MKMAIYYLTCANDWEADKIIKVLLKKRLIACAKKSLVTSTFLWKGNINEESECKLVMESVAKNFDKINKEVKKLHSYETYVLYSISVNQTTKEVEGWLKKELK